MKRFSCVAVVAAWCLAFAVSAFAQIQGGTISGLVKDEQGGVLPGVTVSAQGVDATVEGEADPVGLGQARGANRKVGHSRSGLFLGRKVLSRALVELEWARPFASMKMVPPSGSMGKDARYPDA